MRIVCILLLTAAAAGTALADFSYSTTTKSSGMMGAGDQTSKTSMKGQKMKVDNGSTSTIFDFDAQTITHVDNNAKTYSVSKFADMGQALKQTGAEISIDVKETGEHKTINGYNASEVVLTTDVTMASAKAAGMKMHMEMHMWISRDVPGSQELTAFFQRNADRFPWASMSGGGRGDQSMAQAIAELRRKMAAMKGVPVLQVMKVGMGGNSAQMAQMQQGMAQAQKQLEDMKRQGKLPPQLEQQLAKMQAASSGGSMNETTLESTGFSTSAIPDSVFAVPAGYQQAPHAGSAP
jgi:hypothetical protein